MSSLVACTLIDVLYKRLHLFDAFSIPLVIHGSVYFCFQDILISHLAANLSIQLFNTLHKVSKFSLQLSLLSRPFQSLDFNSAFIFASLVSFRDLILNFNGFLSHILVCLISTIEGRCSLISSKSIRESKLHCNNQLINILSINVAVEFITLVGLVI